jgi:hypothetical protein
VKNRAAFGAVSSVAIIAVALVGCTTTQGRPTAMPSTATTSLSTTASPQAPAATATPPPSSAPTGPPIGTATMRVSGATGPVTIRYQINGGPAQTETGVTLPWEKQYPVFNEISTSVTADAGDTEMDCTIMMDGKLAAFQTGPRPTCSFAYFN